MARIYLSLRQKIAWKLACWSFGILQLNNGVFGGLGVGVLPFIIGPRKKWRQTTMAAIKGGGILPDIQYSRVGERGGFYQQFLRVE